MQTFSFNIIHLYKYGLINSGMSKHQAYKTCAFMDLFMHENAVVISKQLCKLSSLCFCFKRNWCGIGIKSVQVYLIWQICLHVLLYAYLFTFMVEVSVWNWPHSETFFYMHCRILQSSEERSKQGTGNYFSLFSIIMLSLSIHKKLGWVTSIEKLYHASCHIYM